MQKRYYFLFAFITLSCIFYMKELYQNFQYDESIYAKVRNFKTIKKENISYKNDTIYFKLASKILLRGKKEQEFTSSSKDIIMSQNFLRLVLFLKILFFIMKILIVLFFIYNLYIYYQFYQIFYGEKKVYEKAIDIFNNKDFINSDFLLEDLKKIINNKGLGKNIFENLKKYFCKGEDCPEITNQNIYKAFLPHELLEILGEPNSKQEISQQQSGLRKLTLSYLERFNKQRAILRILDRINYYPEDYFTRYPFYEYIRKKILNPSEKNKIN